MDDKFATKQDLQKIDDRLIRLEEKMMFLFTQTEQKLTIRMGAMFATSIAILTAFQKLY